MSPSANRRQCPECHVTLTRYQWSRLWWMSARLSGRLVQPCPECGARLRLSSMAVLSTTSALGLIITAITYALYFRSEYASTLLVISLVFLLLIFIAMLATRLEAAPSIPKDAVPPPRQEPPR